MKIAVTIFIIALVALLAVFFGAIVNLFRMGEDDDLCDFGYIEGDENEDNE